MGTTPVDVHIPYQEVMDYGLKSRPLCHTLGLSAVYFLVATIFWGLVSFTPAAWRNKKKRSVGVVYLLGVFLDRLGAHYFYLGDTGNRKPGKLRLLLLMRLIGLPIFFVLNSIHVCIRTQRTAHVMLKTGDIYRACCS